MQVKVANGIYDFVDSRIQELDAQLAGFDAELTTERARLGVDRVRMSFSSMLHTKEKSYPPVENHAYIPVASAGLSSRRCGVWRRLRWLRVQGHKYM